MILVIMSRMVKQRRESVQSYAEAGRQDMVATEQEELDFIVGYMPKQMTAEEIAVLVDQVIAQLGATTVKDTGKVIAQIRPLVTGKADVALVGDIIKKRLSGK